MKKKLVFIIGPTAVGKSKTAFSLAKKINGEIISADSMQVYKGIDILSAKPSKKIRKEITHYLMDIISPEENFSAADFRIKALAAIKKIHQKKKIPIITGGTGLYVRALLDGLFEVPKADLKIRLRLEKLAAKKGKQYLYDKLTQIDPKAASKIHPNDLRRVIRAIEVYKKSDQPITELQANTKGLRDKYQIKIFSLNLLRPILYQNINKRVEQMFKSGLVEEVRSLLSLKLSQSANQALGIKEIRGYLSDSYTLDEAKRLLARNTRHYAKRQLTWFRKMEGVEWVDKLSATFLARQCLNW